MCRPGLQVYPMSQKKISPSLLKHDWHDEKIPWREEHLQIAAVQYLRRERILFRVGLEGAKRKPSEAGKLKALGLESGPPDIDMYFDGGRTAHVELKRAGGRVSEKQAQYHDELRRLGHDVYVVKAKTPAECVERIESIVAEYEGWV